MARRCRITTSEPGINPNFARAAPMIPLWFSMISWLLPRAPFSGDRILYPAAPKLHQGFTNLLYRCLHEKRLRTFLFNLTYAKAPLFRISCCQYSIPRRALQPFSKGCFTRRISVIKSAASITFGGKSRPVRTTSTPSALPAKAAKTSSSVR